MKKILTCVMALLAAACLYATDLNIYASGLKVTNTASVPSKTTIDYVLNAPATALNVMLYDGSTLIATIPVPAGNENANYTKGPHTGVAIDLAEVANGTYTWKMEATAAAHADFPEVLPAGYDYNIYGTRGVAVDNSTESPYFGRVYVSNAGAGTTSAYSRTTGQGIFIFDATLNALNEDPYDGNVAWTSHHDIGSTNMNYDWGPCRLAIAEDGYVFITDNGIANDDSTGVYMMDPAHPENDFVSVLGHAGTNANFHRANSLAVTGSGADRVLYLLDWSDSIIRYPIGNVYPYTTKGSAVVPNLAGSRIYNAQNSIARDNEGGFWVCQYRGQLDGNPQLAHFNASGELDCEISTADNSTLGLSNTRRGAMGLNPSNTIVAFAGGGTMQVLNIGEDANGRPTLSKIGVTMPTGLGTNVDGIAFDVADNLYVVSASKERLRIFATPKANNTCITAAPSAQQIVVNNIEQLYEIGNNQPSGFVPTEGTAMRKVEGNVFVYEGSLPADTYFAFSTVLAANNDDGGWAYLNSHRYGATTNNLDIAYGDSEDLVAGTNTFKISAAGFYTITVNFNTMKVSVASLPAKVEIMQGWDNWAPVLMTNDDGVTCTATIALEPGDYSGNENGFKVRINDNTIWYGVFDIFKRKMGAANRTKVLNSASDNAGLWADVPGNYIFTYKYATGEMTIAWPESFTRTAEIGDYQTLCVPFTAYVTGAEVYEIKASDIHSGYVTLTAAAAELHAGYSYILKATATTINIYMPGGTVQYEPIQPGGGATGLYGALSVSYLYKYDTETSWRSNYVLQSDNKFHEVQEHGEVTINSTRAYLHIAGGANAPELRIIEAGNEATNIENVEANEDAIKFIQNGQMFIKKNGVVYDMMGHIVR